MNFNSVKLFPKYFNFLNSFIKDLGGLGVFISKAFGILRTEGITGVLLKTKYILTQTKRQSLAKIDDVVYQAWLSKYQQPRNKVLRKIEGDIGKFTTLPVISVIMPTYNSNTIWLREAIESVRNQSYTNWELCISDDASTQQECKDLLKSYEKKDSRIKVVFRNKNGHISLSSNSAIKVASGEWIALLDHDDILDNDALYWVANTINKNPDACLIYSDEDKINSMGQRKDPYFKCDWNYDLFLSQNMISHLGVYRTEIVREIKGFREGFEGSQDYDLALRFIEKISGNQIIHIPRILYHWRIHKQSTSHGVDKKPYALVSAKQAIKEHLERNRIKATVEILKNKMYRVRYNLPTSPPLISIVIPTKNNKSLLTRCINSITTKTDYYNYEIVIVNNNSNEDLTLKYLESISKKPNLKVISYNLDFNFSAINNLAVENAKGDFICFLNDDTEVLSSNWLSEMVSIAIQPGVGVVGARLWYPDNTLQHGGIILGIAGVGSHSHKYLPKFSEGYFNRAGLIQCFSAVTAACMLVNKKVFEDAGGFNDNQLQIAYNDIDLCLKARKLGYRTVWTPYAELIHFESASRGEDTNTRQKERLLLESKYMYDTWGEEIRYDSAYSPNLSIEADDFSLAWPPRVEN